MAEPVYAKTGKGYLKSAGVEELKEVTEQLRVKESPEANALEEKAFREFCEGLD
jgi:hypothetical protein